jgi:hypothetical protein
MTVSWQRRLAHILDPAKGKSMVVALMIAAIGIVLAGLVAIGFGIPVKEFSFGNTLILAGAVAACTGAVMMGLWAVVRELRAIARRLGPDVLARARAQDTLRPEAGAEAPEDGGFRSGRDQPAADGGAYPARAAEQSGASLPWHEGPTSRDRARGDMPAESEPVEAAPAQKPRRNLLFSSLSRKERERAKAQAADSAAADARPPPPGPAAPAISEEGGTPPVIFENAWPKSERARSTDSAPPRRSVRAPSAFAEPNAGAAEQEGQRAARSDDHPAVTVLKSGIVDGMAYSLYSDGSIEAQMPEGMMRFASIDELRAHLDQRP